MRQMLFSRGHISLAAPLLLAIGSGCASTSAPYNPRVIAELGEKLGGCAIGDLDPAPGNEVAVVSVSGALRLVARDGDGWTVRDVGRASGEMIQVAVGDVWPERGGDELVAVGMANGDEDSGGEGAVFVSGYDDETEDYQAAPVFTDAALVHAVAVCDLDPDVPGDEALVGGFSNQLTLLRFLPDGEVTSERVGATTDAAKGMVPFRDGVAIACRDGALMLLEPGAVGFSTRTVFRAPSGLARLATDGERILAASDDGSLWLVGGQEGEQVYRDTKKLRGAVLADLDRGLEGLELATAGYSGVVVTLGSPEGSGWVPEKVFTSDAALHHLSAGDLARAPGPELVAVGFAGEVLLFSRAPVPQD